MKFTHRSKVIISLILAMLFIPLGVLVEEVIGYLSSIRTYHTAVALFEQGGLENHQQALPIFRQLGGLQDASLYALYIEGETHLEEGDLLAASQIFQAVSGNDFLDSANLFDYVMARRAEDADRPRDAMILYHRADIRDASARFDVLQAANPTIDLTKDDIPANAKVSGFAFVYANNIRPVSAPGAAPEPTPIPTATAKKSTAPAQEPPLTFAQFDVVRLLGFDWDASGKLWARVAEAPDTADEAPGDSVGWLAMADLLPMTPADEANYIAVLEAALPPPTDHYARLTTNSVNVRPEPKKNGSNGTVGKTDIVQIFDTVIGEDGTQWRKIMTASGAEGFVPEQYLIPLTESEEIAHRASMGVTSPPKPSVTPIPTLRASAVAVTMPERLALPASLDAVTGTNEQYDLALWLLSVGFTTYEPIPALEKAIALFEGLGNTQNAAAYAKLARFLLLIEQGKIVEAERLLAELYGEGFFSQYNLSKTQSEIPIPTADELYVYLIARRDAKTAEEIEYAIALLDGLKVFDSAARMAFLSQQLSEGPSIEMAVEGLRPRDTVVKPAYLTAEDLAFLKALYNAMAAGDIEGAGELLRANPSDSDARLVKAMQNALFDGEKIVRPMSGHGLVLRAPGRAFYCSFSNGKPNGSGLVVNADSNSSIGMQGTWNGGLLSGSATQTTFYTDGRIWKIEFTAGASGLAQGQVTATWTGPHNNRKSHTDVFAFDAVDGNMSPNNPLRQEKDEGLVLNKRGGTCFIRYDSWKNAEIGRQSEW